MNDMDMFVPLRLHTAYSLAEGAVKIKDLAAHCAKEKIPAIAMTDTGNLFGAIEFSKSLAGEGVQPIIGCQVKTDLFENDPRTQDQLHVPDHLKPYDTLILLAQNEEGYKNLTRLISESYLRQEETKMTFIPLERLKVHHEGLIALSGGLDGAISRLLLQNQTGAAAAILSNFKELFQDRFYLEISRFGLPQERQIEKALVSLAYQADVPLVATNEAFFLSEELYEAHDALLCIAEGTYVAEPNRRRVTKNHRLKSGAEMRALFHDLSEACDNTFIIAQRCAFMVGPKNPILPPFPGERPEPEELAFQAREGLEKRLEMQVLVDVTEEVEREDLRKAYENRLEEELTIITKMGYAGYYLIVADFIKWAKAQNIPVGPGRGSGAGSLVAWSLTITDIDPIRWGLLFERFLNPERVSMPDFDVDFCQDRRDEVIAYVRDRYGADRVAHISTFGKLQARAAVRDVGRVLGIPYGYVDKICKMIPNNPANPVSLEEAIRQEPDLRKAAEDDEQIRRLLDIAMKLEGLYRHASTHAAGVVIGDRPLEELVPLYYDGKSALPATQFNMKDVETVGLVKFDFLGLKTLTIIQKTVDMVREAEGQEIDMSRISLDDQKTFELLQRVETMGIFQVEGAGMRDVLKRLQPNRFEEIIALVALYRPGPMDDIPRYLACKHGEEAVTYAHPMLEEILKETFGVMVYQEQVMQIAQKMAGYSLGGADLLRRAMGKKIKAEMDAQRAIFIEGATKNGVDQKTATVVFDQMAKFASYGFNKCHSGPYGLISYQTAYLKANYPVEFMAATMTYDMNNTDKLSLYRQEVARMGIDLLPLSVNHSFPEFSVERKEDGDLAIRYALAAIKNVGGGAMESLVEERRERGPYKDIVDFICRLDSKVINKRLLESLIAAGAFDELHPSRSQLYASVDVLLQFVGQAKEARTSKQASLFGGGVEEAPQVKFASCSPWTRLTQLQREFEAVGFYLSSHPLETYGEKLKQLNLMPSTRIEEHIAREDGVTFSVAGVVIGKKERLSKNGNRFAFVTFSDPQGIYEVTIFSELYNPNREKLEAGQNFFMRLSGRMEGESLRLTVQEIQPLEETLSRFSSAVQINIEEQGSFEKLKTLLQSAGPGSDTIQLILQTQGRLIHFKLPEKYALTPDIRESVERLPGIRMRD